MPPRVWPLGQTLWGQQKDQTNRTRISSIATVTNDDRFDAYPFPVN